MSAIPRFRKTAVLALSLVTISGSQTKLFERYQARLFAPAAGIQYWSIEENSVHQLAVPLTLVAPFNEKLQATLSTAPALSGYHAGSTLSLNGLSDMRISGSYLFGEEKAMATFGVSLPTGKHALKSDEFLVANILALHALSFDVPILGQGLDATAGMVTARRFNGWVAGLGAGYVMRGAFEAIENATAKYDPGDEINFSLALDKPLGRRNKLMFDANYTIYGTDRMSGEEVFKAGNRFTLQAMLQVPGEGLSWLFSVRDRIRSKNEIGSGTLIPERQNSNGNELEISGQGSLPLNSLTSVHGVVEGRLYSNNAYDIGGAHIVGVGGGYRRKLSSHLHLDSDLRFYIGSLDYGEDLSVKGFRGWVGLKMVL